MSEYTIQLHQLTDINPQTGSCYFDIWYGNNFPIFSEGHRETLKNKIEQHFYRYEIGFETPGEFRRRLKTEMYEIMPKYNRFYKLELTLDGMSPDEAQFWNINRTDTHDLVSDEANTGQGDIHTTGTNTTIFDEDTAQTGTITVTNDLLNTRNETIQRSNEKDTTGNTTETNTYNKDSVTTPDVTVTGTGNSHETRTPNLLDTTNQNIVGDTQTHTETDTVGNEDGTRTPNLTSTRTDDLHSLRTPDLLATRTDNLTSLRTPNLTETLTLNTTERDEGTGTSAGTSQKTTVSTGSKESDTHTVTTSGQMTVQSDTPQNNFDYSTNVISGNMYASLAGKVNNASESDTNYHEDTDQTINENGTTSSNTTDNNTKTRTGTETRVNNGTETILNTGTQTNASTGNENIDNTGTQTTQSTGNERTNIDRTQNVETMVQGNYEENLHGTLARTGLETTDKTYDDLSHTGGTTAFHETGNSNTQGTSHLNEKLLFEHTQTQGTSADTGDVVTEYDTNTAHTGDNKLEMNTNVNKTDNFNKNIGLHEVTKSQGNIYADVPYDILERIKSKITDIDMLIINDLKCLFMLTWA